jgi:hypothetical protein
VRGVSRNALLHLEETIARCPAGGKTGMKISNKYMAHGFQTPLGWRVRDFEGLDGPIETASGW